MKSDNKAKQQQWLQTLQSLSKRPIKVSKNVDGKPSKWISVKDAVLPVDYRTVLHNEIVIDIDSTKWKDARMFAEIITDTVNRLHIPHITAYTGGRGVHLHFFFSLSENQKKQCEEIDVMPKDLRMWLFHHVLKDAGISPKLIGPGKPFDTSCVNWSDEGKGHLVRIFGGKKRRYKTLVTEIPEERPKTDDSVFPDDVTPWKIPDMLFQEFIEYFKKSHKKRVEISKRYHIASQNFAGKYLNLPCIQTILKGLPEGQRNAGAHILAIACKLDNVLKEEADKLMLTYSDTCSKDNISESEYLGWTDWIYSQKEHFWNCRFCKELKLCEQKICDLYESAFAKEHEFLKDTDLLHNVSKVLDKKIKKEEKNRLIVFFVYLSAYGSNPLNLFLKGESSIGKTYLAKSVAEYFPEEDVWFIGDMSPKALLHEHGTLENGKVHVSLQNKILVFLETPRRQTLEMLKPILSHDRKEIEYKIADRASSGKLQTKSVIIEGWPSTIFCTTDHRYLEELSTRSLLTTPEATQEKIAHVLKYKGRIYSKPWEQIKKDQEEEVFKNAIKLLKSHSEVCIPYADVLAERYTKTEPRVMRDFDKLMELIKMSAFLHQRQRPSFEVDNGNDSVQYIIANEYDYKIGFDLFDHIRETTVTGLAKPIIDFYEKVISELDYITYSSLMKKFKEVYGKLIGRDQIRNKYIAPLETVGWLDRDKDPTDGRVVVFEKCKNEEETPEKTRLSTSLVLKDIFSEDELKEYLNDIEKECERNKGLKHVVYGDGRLDGSTGWFYCDENSVYFLEEKENSNEVLGKESEVENKSRVSSYNSDEKKEDCEMEEQRSKDIEKIEHINKNIKENEVKKQCLIGNSEQMKLHCKVGENELIDIYDEEIVLQQIPEEDTKIEDVTKKFKDQSMVINTIIILKEKKKVILGQGYIRRPGKSKDKIDQYDEETVLQMIPEENIKIKDFVNKFEDPNKVVDTLYILEKKGKITASQGCMRKVKTPRTEPDPPEPLLNTWTCGMCGIKFKAQIPYEDHDGHAICEDCWKKLTES
jgi:hypothetical protein